MKQGDWKPYCRGVDQASEDISTYGLPAVFLFASQTLSDPFFGMPDLSDAYRIGYMRRVLNAIEHSTGTEQ